MGLGKVEVTAGFLLLLAWLNYLDNSLIVPMAAAACLAHELGHLAVIRLIGGTVRRIRLTAIGAEIVLARGLSYWQEGLSALAGPGINLVLALVCCGLERGVTFAGLNLALALFNLLPVGRLDGGRALYCTLALLAGPELASRIGNWLDVLSTGAVLAAGLALAGRNLTLLLVGFWLLAAFLKQKFYPHYRNSTCQRGRKKVQ